jgi:hypothetical protein
MRVASSALTTVVMTMRAEEVGSSMSPSSM